MKPSFYQFNPWVRSLLILILLSALGGYSQAQTIRYVRPVATGLGDGSSWANASADLQAMINTSGTQQVYVAEGRYTRVGGNSFSLKSGVALYGGFSSTAPETRPSQRPAINPISGQYSSTTLTVGSNGGSVLRHTGGIDSTAILDGVVITGGSANMGAGIFNSNSSPIITNCLISGNATNQLGIGGGVYNQDSNLRLINCLITENSAADGGGFYHIDYSAFASFPRLINCVVSNNTARWGGGISNKDSSPYFTGCLISGNSAILDGGGIANRGVYQRVGEASLSNCIIRDNTAGRDGGGIHNKASQFGQKTYPSLRNCVIRGNQATSSGGGMFNDDDSRPRLTNCLIIANSAANGGGIFNNVSSPILNGCTLTANRASDGGAALGNGGSSSRGNLTNCILWDNQEENSASISFDGGRVGATLVVNYCLIGQGEGDVAGAHNLTATTSPFAGPSDYQLAPCSIAINTGDPKSTTAVSVDDPASFALASGPTDLAGNARFYNTRIDLGAYEFQGLNGTDGFPLEITQQPAGVQTVAVGTSVSAMVTVSGTNPTYQWYKDNLTNPVPGQTSATLSLTNVQSSDTGFYVAVITGSCNSLTSTAFGLNLIQPIRYVKEGGTGLGTSWAAASGDLQSQIYTEGAEQVWVAQGTYRPTNFGSPLKSFSMKNNVAIYGGFPDDNSGTMASRNPASYPTTLTGDIGLRGVDRDNAYQVIRNQDLDNTAVLDGVIITGGTAIGTNGTNNLGGGMYNSNSNPRILNCILRLNTALGNGGGMYNTNSSPTLINCIVQANNAVDNGGGIYNVNFSSPQLINCLLWGNTASLGKAIDNRNFSRPSLTNCIVWNNDGQSAFLNEDGSSSLTASFCLIEPEETSYIGSNILTSDPRFVDAAGGNFRLMAGSPGINAGSTSAYTDVPGGMPPSPTTDLGGTGRIQGVTIDIGPYEFSLPPDLTPLLYVTPSLAYSTTTGSVVVDVFEINSAPTSGLITVYIAKSSLLSLRFDPGATSLAGKPVQNSLWSFDGTSNSDAYILTTTQVIGASGKRSIGLGSTLTPGQTRGRVSVTATLVGGSGGEVTLTNNTDADQVEYFNK